MAKRVDWIANMFQYMNHANDFELLRGRNVRNVRVGRNPGALALFAAYRRELNNSSISPSTFR